MAGSWGHLTDDNGRLLSPFALNDMLENGGDVYEAAEQCYGMIWWMAAALAGEGDGPGDRPHLLGIIGQALEGYRDGLALGGVQDE